MSFIVALAWMREYRKFVEAMVRYGNAYSQAVNIKGVIDDPPLDSTELQVMEYILENEDVHDNMSTIANRLQISQSSFSRISNRLVKYGLLEKYHLSNNRKDIIIQLTPHARKVYEEYANGPRTEVWRKTFEILDTLPAEEVQKIIQLLDMHSEYLYRGIGRIGEKEHPTLVKIDQEEN